jgi:asparagine synthase (glutamine-hydrolysing)
MSGGLDSTSIVAFLLQLVGDKSSDIVVTSSYFENLIYDDERRYAAAVANHFGISINFHRMDSTVYDPQWWTRSWVPPEPNEFALWKFVAIDSTQPDPFSTIRVVFIGHGPDDALQYMDWKPYLRWLLKTGRLIKFASALRSRISGRPLAELFSSLRAALPSHRTIPVPPEKPAWLRRDTLDNRVLSGESQQHQQDIAKKRHPWHPTAVAHYCSPGWQDFFESFDPGFGGRLVDAVHPYLDLRMLQFLLSVPVVPWCHRKLLLRESMRDLLPELVLTRKKTPLPEDPWIKAMVRHPFPPISKTPELSRYVDMTKIPSRWEADVAQNRMIRRFVVLQHWLAGRNRRSSSLNR